VNIGAVVRYFGTFGRVCNCGKWNDVYTNLSWCHG